MSFETNYSETRRCAAYVIWALSSDLKGMPRDFIIRNPDVPVQFGETIDWMIGLVCDDWDDINLIAKELETLKVPYHQYSDPTTMRRFNSLLKEVEKAAGVEIIRDETIDELKPLSVLEYEILGVGLGFIVRFKTFFKRKPAFFLSQR